MVLAISAALSPFGFGGFATAIDQTDVITSD
jgi:hypothetical protein